MSEHTRQSGRPRGMGHGPGGGMMPGEKAKDFKGTIGKLIRYMGNFKYAILAVMVFAVGSTVAVCSCFNGFWHCRAEDSRAGHYGAFYRSDGEAYGNGRNQFYENCADFAFFSGPLRNQRRLFIYSGMDNDRSVAKTLLPVPPGDIRENQPDAHEVL